MKISSIIVVLSIIILGSCDTRDDYYSLLNDTPDLKIWNPKTESFTDGQITDSIKIGYNSYRLNYQIKDTNNVKITYKVIRGDIGVNIDEINSYINFIPGTSGQNEIEIKATDPLGKEDVMTSYIEVFNNLLPVVKYTISEGDNFMVTVDASESYDQDSYFGGKIILYRFKMSNNFIKEIAYPTLNYQYGNAGTYKITVEVKDNNNEWSEAVEKIIVLN